MTAIPLGVPRRLVEFTLDGQEARVPEGSTILDACRAGLDPNAVRAECAARSLPFVDLWSPSVAGGGLVNGFPARLPPYHEWEAKLPRHETRDGAGHVHKSHILGGYRTRLGSDPELDNAAREKYVDLGLASMKQALDIRPDYFEAMVYYNLLFRQKADVTVDPVQKQQYIDMANQWRDKAVALRKQQQAAQPKPAA